MNDWLRRLVLFLLGRAVRAMSVGLLLTIPVSCAFGGPDLQAVADSFDAPSAWRVLGDADVTETLCIGSACKTVVMAWSSDSAPTAAEFDTLMQQAGWEDVEVSDCHVNPNVTGPIPFCRASASSEGTRIELTAAGPLVGETHPFRITLRVGSK